MITPYITDAGYGNLQAKITFVWAGAIVLFTGVVFFFVPETKGLSIGQVSDLYASPVAARRDTRAQANIDHSGAATSARAGVEMSGSTPTLESLPTEIIQRIAFFLQPRIPPHLNNKTNDSSYWTQSSTDLIQLRYTSRTLWQAARGLVGVHFGVKVSGIEDGVDLAAELDAISGQGEVGGRPNLLAGEDGRGVTGDEVVRRAVAQRNGWVPPPKGPQFLIPGLRVRHFHLHVTDDGLATFHQAHLIASALRSMPRLESFAFVFKSEVEVCEESPYRAAVLSADTFAALAELPRLQAISLCGVKLALRPAYGPIYDTFPPFGPSLTELNLSAVHDSALALIAAAKGLKEVHAWRDFARAPRIGAGDWWDDGLWATVEELDLLGWAGSQGRPMLDHLVKSIVSYKSANPSTAIPLRSLRLLEPYPNKLLIEQTLPAFTGLPKLESLGIIVWRDRNFGPDILVKIAEVAPTLKELTLALENEQLNWWPGSMADYSTSLALFERLEVLTWNYSPYADITFDETKPNVMGPVMTLTSHSPALRELRWTGQDDYLKRDGPDRPWLWHRDAPQDRINPTPDLLLADADDDPAEADPAGHDKENQALARCETQTEQTRPPEDAAARRRDKAKGRASLGAEVRVADGLGRGVAGEGSGRSNERKGPRRSLFGDITKSATASPAGLDLGPVTRRGAGAPSSQELEGKEVAPGGAGEDDSGFFE